MKTLPILLTGSLLLAAPLFAQEEAAPPARLELMPSQPATVLPADPMPLIPELPTPVEKPKGRAIDAPKKEKKSSTEASADEIQSRIRFRQAKTRVVDDPALRALWDRAHEARTDLEKREGMKAYYKMLFARMLKVDPSLKAPVLLAQGRALRRLEQREIDPTEPLDPEDRGERVVRP